MKYTLLFFLSLPVVLSAQREVLIRSWQDTLRMTATIRDGKLWLQQAGGERTEQPTLRRPLVLRSARLEDADLLLRYALAETEKGFYYKLVAEVLTGEGEPVRTGPGGFGELPSGMPGDREITWIDATEEGLEFGRAYRLVLTAELWGAVNCAGERPRFTLSRQLPHYAAAGVGLALVGVGQLYRQQKVDQYETYRDYRAQGKSRADAQPFYDAAVDKEKSTKLFTYSGWAILGLDAALFLYRMIDTRQQQKQWDRYCAPSSVTLRLSPLPGAGRLYTATATEICWTIRF